MTCDLSPRRYESLVRAMSSITPEERHEIAERLRHLTPSKHVHSNYKPRYTDICTAIGGKKGYCLGISALAERLANLIDPTCHDFGGEEGTNGEGYNFACSACGYCCDLPNPDYCPYCGARVVSEDAKKHC